MKATGDIRRCPFVRALMQGRAADAWAMAAAEPEPAEPVVIEWLFAEARRQLEAQR
jgi:hypothetical protein